MTKRPKILLVLPIRFSVRGFFRTPVAALLREQADLAVLSPFAHDQAFAREMKVLGIDSYELRDFKITGSYHSWYTIYQKAIRRRWNNEAYKVVDEIHRWYRHHDPARSSVKAKRSLRERVARLLIRIGGRSMFVLQWLRQREHAEFRKQDDDYYRNMFREIKPDLVVSTSPNRPQEIPLARAAADLHIPNICYILSFDNICCYESYPVVYQHYMVWNERNKREVVRQYPPVKDDEVTVCGPLQFDFYAQKEKYLIDRAAWCGRFGLDPVRPVVLYGETGHVVAPHEVEVVSDLLERFGALPEISRPQVLIRLHPMYPPDRWQPLRERFPELRFQETNNMNGTTTLRYVDGNSWGDEELAGLINTIAHAAVVVHVSSSLALDAAYLDRPSISIAYDPTPGASYDRICKRLYEREHYLDITQSGACPLAFDGAQAMKEILAYIDDPKRHVAERKAMLRVYDPFLDGRAHERVASTILKFVSR